MFNKKKGHIQAGGLMYSVVNLFMCQISIYHIREYFIKANRKVTISEQGMVFCLTLYNALSVSLSVRK